jgi:hypothetical protein
MASRGFGNAPSGFAADQSRLAAEDQVGAQGQAFTDQAGRSLTDATNDFWNATNLASGAGAAATNAAISGDSAAANNYANLYGTASTPRPSAVGSIIGGGLQAGGSVGAAAMCPVEGSLILMHDGTERLVEQLRKGDELRGVDGQPCALLNDPHMSLRSSVELRSGELAHKCSAEHTLMLGFGGYTFAAKAEGKRTLARGDGSLSSPAGHSTIELVTDIGRQPIYFLEIDGSHTYRADSFWAMS